MWVSMVRWEDTRKQDYIAVAVKLRKNVLHDNSM